MPHVPPRGSSCRTVRRSKSPVPACSRFLAHELPAREVVRDAGAEPVLLLPVVDRGGTVAAMAAEHGLLLRALVTAPDLGFDYEG